MKTLLKIFLTLFVLAVVLLGVAYFAATRPGLQKRLIEAQLPEGSTIERVHIRPKNLSLLGVDIQMPDGSSLQLGRLESGFSPLAAVFRKKIRLSGLEVEGLVVQVPRAKVDEPRSLQGTAGSSGQPAESGVREAPPAADSAEPTSAPSDALYALGRLEWLFDIDSINVQGAIIDAYENRFSFNVESGQIAPGLETDLEASFSLESKEAMQGGLQEFASEVRLHFKQNETGGFESLALDSTTAGSDASGASLLSASQTLTLQVDARGGNAEMKFGVNVDLPQPGVFLPELASLTEVVLQAEMRAAADGPVLTLNEAMLDLSAGGQPVAKINLEQALTLGAEQQFSGRLMTAELISLPLEWLNPWLGEGLQLSGAPVAAQFLLQGGSDGSLEVSSEQALRWGPISLSQSGQPLIDKVTLAVDPRIRIDADQTLDYDLRSLELADRYGVIIRGSVSGQKGAAGVDALFAGITTEAKLEVGLSEILQQPALAGRAGILSGQARLQLSVDEAAEFPVRIQASVDSLRARSLPGARQDYRLAAQLKRSESGTYALGTNLQAGLESRPTTTVQLSGQVQPDRSPLPFKVDLNAPSVRQSDLDILLAAFTPEATAPAIADPLTQRPGAAPDPSDRPSGTGAVVRPPWANLDGSANVRIDELTLNSGPVIRGVSAQAEVKEALLEIRQIKASLEAGQVAGRARVDFDAERPTPYTIYSQLNFENVDPAVFSQRPGGAFPVRGLFNGEFDLKGSGPTLSAALENSDAALRINGREGVLTAFDLDSRSQLGLLGAGILGQQLERPGITAMAEAVPYFKDMRFENFTLNLTRGQDKVVRIPELTFLGDYLRIEGQGLIAASRLDEVLKQPLQLSLALGAKGRLVDYLETLQLLGSQTGPDGFRSWKRSIEIGGTLGDPDTSALKDMLTEAARRAVSGRTVEEGANPEPNSGSSEEAQPAPAEKTKQEHRRDEIDMGLDLLNSVFGN